MHRAPAWRRAPPRAGSPRVGDGTDGNRPGGSAAQGRPWCLQHWRPWRPERSLRGKKKARSFWGAGRGSYAKTLAYPDAPKELARLMRTATGVRLAVFMDELLCTEVNVSSAARRCQEAAALDTFTA